MLTESGYFRVTPLRESEWKPAKRRGGENVTVIDWSRGTSKRMKIAQEVLAATSVSSGSSSSLRQDI